MGRTVLLATLALCLLALALPLLKRVPRTQPTGGPPPAQAVATAEPTALPCDAVAVQPPPATRATAVRPTPQQQRDLEALSPALRAGGRRTLPNPDTGVPPPEQMAALRRVRTVSLDVAQSYESAATDTVLDIAGLATAMLESCAIRVLPTGDPTADATLQIRFRARARSVTYKSRGGGWAALSTLDLKQGARAACRYAWVARHGAVLFAQVSQAEEQPAMAVGGDVDSLPQTDHQDYQQCLLNAFVLPFLNTVAAVTDRPLADPLMAAYARGDAQVRYALALAICERRLTDARAIDLRNPFPPGYDDATGKPVSTGLTDTRSLAALEVLNLECLRGLHSLQRLSILGKARIRGAAVLPALPKLASYTVNGAAVPLRSAAASAAPAGTVAAPKRATEALVQPSRPPSQPPRTRYSMPGGGSERR